MKDVAVACALACGLALLSLAAAARGIAPCAAPRAHARTIVAMKTPFSALPVRSSPRRSVSALALGDIGVFPAPQPSPDEPAASPGGPLILVAPFLAPVAAPNRPESGPRILFVTGKEAPEPHAPLPRVIYGDLPARRMNGPEILYGDDWR